MLGITSRRILLSIHILLNSILVGGFAAILYLNLAKNSTSSGDQLYAMNLAIFKIHDAIIANIAFAVIITGLLFSLFTKWGFFDFYWVTIKWLTLAIMFYLIINYMGPAVNGMAAISDVERIQALSNPLYLKYEKDTGMFALLLLVIPIFMIAISVFKPWGKRKKLFNVNRKIVLIIGSVLGLVVIISVFMQFIQLQSYRKMQIKNVDPAAIADGTYLGEADYGFNYKVEVVVKDHKIDRISIIENRNSFYAQLAESVTTRVIAAQNPNVNAVTGATTTSKCLLKALENAIEKGSLE